MTHGLPRARRFVVLGGLAALGAALFVPFLQAGAPTPLSGAVAGAFVLAATAVSAVATWVGLGWGDRAALPMPLLRALEARTPLEISRSALSRALVSGAVLGLAGLMMLRLLHIPTGGGSLTVRIGSALFAAITLESVLHLAVMSGVVRATGRVNLGILVAALVYVGFHLATLGGQPTAVVAVATVGHGLGGLLFGWLYARDGYEYLVLAHLVAHATTVGLA